MTETKTGLDVQMVRERALLGARWYANTQVRMRKPHWDANHGRYVYTYHIPTKDRVLGLSWTQGRGNFAVMAAYELSGDVALLNTARLATEYIKVLQIMDVRTPRLLGAIHEEVPTSWYMYPRDAMEAALGLLFQYRLLSDADCLERAELFARCLINYHFDESGWIPGGVSLDPTYKVEPRLRHICCIGGGANLFYYLAQATGDEEYLDRGFRRLAEHMLREFVREDGVIVSDAARHHTGAADERAMAPVLNDDGCGITLITAAAALGEQRYLDLAVQYGDWLLTQDYPARIHSALPIRMITLAELSAVTGEKKYGEFAAHLVPLLLRNQAIAPDDPAVHGAFRGEDEGGPAYGYPHSTPLDFVCNRMTSYSVLALLKATGDIVGPYYSGLNWETRRVTPPTTLTPLREI
jgi:hypothetical protein